MTPPSVSARGVVDVAREAQTTSAASPTLWGLTPHGLHDRYWASRGVQVVRGGGRETISPHATCYLLMEPGALTLFDLPESPAAASTLIYLRIHDTRERGLRERVVTDAGGKFVRFERLYRRHGSRLTRAAITRDAELAQQWQAEDSWKALRAAVRKPRRDSIERRGMWFDGGEPWDVAAFVRELTRVWTDPSAASGSVSRVSQGVWRDAESFIHPEARLVHPVWIGRGRQADAGTMVIGPTVLWDDPAHRVVSEPFDWQGGSKDAPVTPPLVRSRPRNPRRFYLRMKRAFDVAFALAALTMTLPFYPFVLALIWLDDGRPFFFGHRRETRNGREFPCLKFRSMRRNADGMKAELQRQNQADGPQFFIGNDPRLTRVGKLLRKFHVDEWPQFLNVLAGHMSIVGPRPSPFKENQCCPAWRQLRLSVRPGVTGLWQVKRTRAPGTDFQEWIRYDIEYVESASWMTDLRVLFLTLLTFVRRG